jgi:hypothetical protein
MAQRLANDYDENANVDKDSSSIRKQLFRQRVHLFSSVKAGANCLIGNIITEKMFSQGELRAMNMCQCHKQNERCW